MAAQALISLGANLGDRTGALRESLRQLDAHSEVRVVRSSRLFETQPIGGPPGQAGFLNGAALLHTSLAPAALLGVLLQIEAQLGRTRDVRWGPRLIDLDLLLYDDVVLHEPSLTLPHPRMAWRRFVLEPAAEAAPEMRHPTIGWTISGLLRHLNTAPYYAALTGSIGAGKTELARRLESHLRARRLAEEVDAERLSTFYADPASHAWAVELEFLNQRRRLLSAEGRLWRDRQAPVVSDFWFDQSAAFARVWLPPDQYARFAAQLEAARQQVVRPRLVVLLEATGPELHERVLRRGRACERGLTAAVLDRIAQAIDRQTREPDVGPVLRIRSDAPNAALAEVAAAVEAMA